MFKLEILQRIVGSGLVAVIRAATPEQAGKAAEACIKGGVEALEITFTVPGASAAIAELIKRYPRGQVAIGAGTVLDTETARIAILAGAQFIVSPASDSETGRLCRRYQIPYLPGAGTAGEVLKALEDGGDIIKVFPGELLGSAFIKAIHGPLPQAPLMPTGGVTVDNAGSWIEAGCVALGVGGSLTKGAQSGDYESIAKIARQLIEKIKQARRG